MKTFSTARASGELNIFAAAVAMGTTALSGAIFYMVQKFHSEISSWFIAGSVTASITALCAVAAVRIYTAKRTPSLRSDHSYFEKQAKKTGSEHLRSQLIITGTARKLHHETVNFLNNIDLVIHGLKNETLSPGGSRILRLLMGENERIKIYIQKYRSVLQFGAINEDAYSIERIIQDVVLNWRQTAGKPEIKTRFHWQSHQDTVCMDTHLIKEAFSSLLDFMACHQKTGQIFEIYGKGDGNNTTIILIYPDTGILNLENIDMFEPFTARDGEDATISKLFIARTIIEAHKGKIDLKEDGDGKLTFKVSLPLFFEKGQ